MKAKRIIVPVCRQNQLARIKKNGGHVIRMSDSTFHLPNGREIAASLVHKMLGEGYLLSNNDGLLSDCAQTLSVNKKMLTRAKLAKRRAHA